MSPSEGQLRAALHHGEGEGLAAGALISHAVGVRRERRRRVTAIAGGVAVVAVVGLGATALGTLGHDTNGGSTPSGSANTDNRMHAGGGQAGGAAQSSAGASGTHTGAAAGLTCPRTPDVFYLPGGGGSGQFGSTDPLFTRPVVAMKVCGYPLTGMPGRAASLVVGPPDARPIADSMNSAASTPPPSRVCPDNTAIPSGRIEILALDAKGKKLDPVVVTVTCSATKATNGTALRYLTDLPQRFIGLLGAGPIAPIGTGTMHGSPVR